jgi:hypothetical protein
MELRSNRKENHVSGKPTTAKWKIPTESKQTLAFPGIDPMIRIVKHQLESQVGMIQARQTALLDRLGEPAVIS